MTQIDPQSQSLGKTMEMLSPGAPILLLGGVCAGIGAAMVGDRVVMVALLSVAAAFLALAMVLKGGAVLRARGQGRLTLEIVRLIANDPTATFATDAGGTVRVQNAAATERYGVKSGMTLVGALGTLFAEPHAVLLRMQSRAIGCGAAREDVATRRGAVRVGVHRVGTEEFLWRIEDEQEGEPGQRGRDAIRLPMMTVSRSGTVLFMNEALRVLTGARHPTVERILSDLPLRPGTVHEVVTPKGPMRCLAAEVDIGGGRSEIYLFPHEAAGGGQDLVTFETLPVALLWLEERGDAVVANRAARAFLGDVAPGTRMSDLFEGLGRPVEDWVRDAVNGRTDRRPEVMRVRRSGRELFLQVTLSRIAEPGRPGLVAVMSDATQLKKLEAQFTQSQKMQAIGQLAGGVAHDFNNLLTAITGHCDLLMLRHDKGDPDHADLDQISQNANRAAALVGQLLAFSRKQTLKPRVIDLRDTLSDLAHLLNRLVGERISLSLEHDPGLRTIRADKRQLEQVIMNLVVNARDAMPSGGAIRIETKSIELSEDLNRDRATVPKGEYVLVQVIDEGVGVAPDNLSKIFEPFFTTKRTGEGTGLGLSTAYGIVKQTGGYIFCDSVLGAGTTFSLYLPASDQCATEEPEDRPRRIPDFAHISRSATVLLVEDETPVRAFASRALKLRGYTVHEAGCGEEALALLKDRKLVVDAIVTDVIMPGLDGPAWVTEALKNRPGTPVIFVSGYAEDVFVDGRAPVPNATFLPKPFSLSELTATVQNQIARCEAAA